MQPAFTDDQDFQPAKRQRTACKLQHGDIKGEFGQQIPRRSGEMVSCGKENVAPMPETQPVIRKICTHHNFLDGNHQSCPRSHEALLGRRGSSAQWYVQQDFSAGVSAEPSVLSVRAFFTKSRGKQTWHGRVLPSAAAQTMSLDAINLHRETDQSMLLSSSEQTALPPTSADSLPSSLHKQKLGSTKTADAAAVIQIDTGRTATRVGDAQINIYTPSACRLRASLASHITAETALMPKVKQTFQPDTTAESSIKAQAGVTAPSPLPGDFVVLDASDSDSDDASDDGHCAELKTQALQSEQAVLSWLQQHSLSAYAAAFSQAEVDLDLIPCLTDADLKQMGINALGPRRKILAAAAKLTLPCDVAEPAAKTHLPDLKVSQSQKLPS